MSSAIPKSWRQRRASCLGIVKTPWVIACAASVAVAIILGISLGWTFRGNEMDLELDNALGGRVLTTELTLISIDTTAGIANFQWLIQDDSCIRENDNVTDESCPIVNIYMDPNLVNSPTCSTPDTPSANNNIPDQPVFQFNASAFINEYTYANTPTFRTQIYLWPKSYTLEASPANYPWDKYTIWPWVFAQLNNTAEPVGIAIDPVNGAAVGFQAHAHNGYSYSYNTTLLYLTISRSILTKVYVIAIVASMWLVALVFIAITVKGVIMGHGQRKEILLMPVTTLFAFTSLRGTMPGAPQSFGVLIDFVATLPSFVFLAFAAVICLAPFLLDYDPEKPRGYQNRCAMHTDDSDDEFLGAEGFPLPRLRLQKTRSPRSYHYDPYSSKNMHGHYQSTRASFQDMAPNISQQDAAENEIFDHHKL